MKKLLLFAAVVFCLFLALPLFQMLTGFPPDYKLAGVETPAARPPLGLSAWWQGTLQSGFDTWLNQNIGGRGVLVRTANQLRYSLFRELPVRGGTQVRMGRDRVLYENAYLEAYNANGKRPGAELRDISASTRRLQDRLAADGVAFLLVIAPSKAEIYPEFLPPEADVAGRPGRRSNYENMVPLLQADGVNLIDAHELFLQWKAEPGTPMLFSKGGTHWNDYGAARVVAELMDRLRELTRKELPAVVIDGAVTNRTIVGADNDLGELLNLWSCRSFAGPQIHPVVRILPGRTDPDLLVIGDSFIFTLTNFMDQHRLYRQRDTYYYYNRQYAYPQGKDFPLDKQQLDLLAQVRGRDAVVVEVSEYWMPRIGFGFVRDLLKAYATLDAANPAGAPP